MTFAMKMKATNNIGFFELVTDLRYFINSYNIHIHINLSNIKQCSLDGGTPKQFSVFQKFLQTIKGENIF